MRWAGGPEEVTVSMADIDAGQRRAIERAALDIALPELAAWLQWAADAPEGRRILGLHHIWFWMGGAITSQEIRR